MRWTRKSCPHIFYVIVDSTVSRINAFSDNGRIWSLNKHVKVSNVNVTEKKHMDINHKKLTSALHLIMSDNQSAGNFEMNQHSEDCSSSVSVVLICKRTISWSMYPNFFDREDLVNSNGWKRYIKIMPTNNLI